jgi:hypothetical protein
VVVDADGRFLGTVAATAVLAAAERRRAAVPEEA